jgi:hypothetical protein
MINFWQEQVRRNKKKIKVEGVVGGCSALHDDREGEKEENHHDVLSGLLELPPNFHTIEFHI